MNYELAKKLKDLGFPQHFGETRGIKGEYMYKDEKPFYIPTLSELIEVCGDGFINLTRCDTWWLTNHDVEEDGIFYGASAKSPEEAVANLWLSMNSPSSQ